MYTLFFTRVEFTHFFASSAPEFMLFSRHYVIRYTFLLLCRFCTSWCAKKQSGVKFCWKYGSSSQWPLSGEGAGPSSPKTSFEKPVLLQGKHQTKSIEDYMPCKKKQQQSGSKFLPHVSNGRERSRFLNGKEPPRNWNGYLSLFPRHMHTTKGKKNKRGARGLTEEEISASKHGDRHGDRQLTER